MCIDAHHRYLDDLQFLEWSQPVVRIPPVVHLDFQLVVCGLVHSMLHYFLNRKMPNLVRDIRLQMMLNGTWLHIRVRLPDDSGISQRGRAQSLKAMLPFQNLVHWYWYSGTWWHQEDVKWYPSGKRLGTLALHHQLHQSLTWKSRWNWMLQIPCFDLTYWLWSISVPA